MSELERAFRRAVLETVIHEGVPGLLGKTDGTLFYTDDTGTRHKDRVWARIGGGTSPTEAVVRCIDVPQTLNLPVIVAERDGVLTAVRTDTNRATDWAGGTLANVKPHVWTHGRYGSDSLYITGLSFLPLAAYPSSPPALTVTVEQCFYRYAGTRKVFERTTSGSLSAYRPAGTDVTHYVILALDRSDNSLDIIDGDDVTGGNRALPSAATVLATAGVNPEHWPIAAIRLYAEQTQVLPRDIFMDLRPWAGDHTGASTASINFIIDGGGSAITTGIKGDVVVDFACVIQSATLLADQSGNIVVDIWKDTYANAPADDADSITAAAPPTISGATKSQDTILAGWTTAIAAGDVLRFNVDSVATVTRITVALEVERS